MVVEKRRVRGNTRRSDNTNSCKSSLTSSSMVFSLFALAEEGFSRRALLLGDFLVLLLPLGFFFSEVAEAAEEESEEDILQRQRI